MQRRIIETHEKTFEALINQADPASSTWNTDIKTFIANHRDSSGVKATCHMIEYSLGLELPDDLLKHPDVHRIRDLTAELVVLINDIVSHAKEVVVRSALSKLERY